MIYKKTILVLLGGLFFTQRLLQASQIDDALPDKEDSAKVASAISNTKDFSRVNFKGKTLPKDLSSANLTGANFTGHHFSDTNFAGAVLSGVILTNTTCNYLQCFQDNLKANELYGGAWYHNNLPKDLKSIAQIYPNIVENSHKSALLQIASGLAYSPCYKDAIFYIKAQYWSCKLYMLKEQLRDLGTQLVCSMGKYIKIDALEYAWKTDYPIHFEYPKGIQVASYWYRLGIKTPFIKDVGLLIQRFLMPPPELTKHDDFNQYLKAFQKGILTYNCRSNKINGYHFYKYNIEKNIKGLQKIYPKLTSEKLKKEAIDIAFELSQKYKYQHLSLLYTYLVLQNRLINLQLSANTEIRKKIYYNLIISIELIMGGME